MMPRAVAVALVVALAAALGDVASCARPVAFSGSSRDVGLLSARERDDHLQQHLEDVMRHQHLDALMPLRYL